MRRSSSFIVALVLTALFLQILPGSAATDIILRRGAGTVGYRVSSSSPLITVTGQQTVAENSYAETGASSLGIIVFPDSSLLRLGASTTIQLSAFKDAEQGGGSTIRVGSGGGALRFQVRHPVGGKSSYNFNTSIMNIAVRGTTALLADGPDGDVLTCLDCSAGDVVVTAAGKTYALLTGQTMIVTPNGRVSVDTTSNAVLTQFTNAGLSATITPEEAAGTGVAAAPPNPALVPIAGVAIAGIIVAAASHSGSASSQQSPSPTSVPTTPTPTPSAGFGPVNLSPTSVNLTVTNPSATITASQTGNTSGQFIPSAPTVVCPNGGSATITAQSAGTFLVTRQTVPSAQSCTATINGLGGFSATLLIQLS